MRPTRLLVFVLVIVFGRWVELRTGWPDAVTLPLSALVGLALFDRLAVPRELRLTSREWAANLVCAAAVGLVVWLATR